MFISELTVDLKRSLEYAVKPSAPVTLNAFLDLAGVKFMDLTATKRRYTVAPTPSKTSANHSRDSEVSSFEDSVAAGACIVPELELYQHSCRELKRYMSEGKTFLKQLEAEVAANAPPFVSLYMAASPAERESWDRLVVDAKTRARHHSKEIWYGWRSQLLQGLQDGLRGIEKGLDADAAELRRRRQHVDAILPEALREQEALEKELAMLQDMAAQNSTEDKESLQAARSELVELDATVIEQQDMLAQLRLELEEQEREAEFLIDSRSEATAAIEELNRVKEASRAISKGHHRRHCVVPHHDLPLLPPALLQPLLLPPLRHGQISLPPTSIVISDQPHLHRRQPRHDREALLPPTPPRAAAHAGPARRPRPRPPLLPLIRLGHRPRRRG